MGLQHRRLMAYANSPESKKAIPGLIKARAGLGGWRARGTRVASNVAWG